MRVLAVADHVDPLVYSHNIKSRFNAVDFVIGAGDLDISYYEYIVSCLNKPLYFVFGNHNLTEFSMFHPSQGAFPPDHTKNSIAMHYGSCCVDGTIKRDKKTGIIIAGLGGSQRYNNEKHQYTELQMFLRILKLIPHMMIYRIKYGRWADLLVTHATPKGIHDREDLCHQGFKCFLWFIKVFKPRYLIHGHVHLYDINAQRQSELYNTRIINAYNHIIFDWEKGMENKPYLNNLVEQDFNKAKLLAWMESLRSIVNPQAGQLLAFHDIKELVKTSGEKYLGMQTVPIKSIAGSEDRYRDFSRHFFPRKEHLRYRWMSIDSAYLTNVILPPIKLLKIGDVYFVRDGNHRVSVALTQGVLSIDAEVIELTSELSISANATRDEILKAVIEWERQCVLGQTGIDQMIPVETITFTTPGRWYEVLNHLEGHKYYRSLEQNGEISFQEAVHSWHSNLYIPIVEIVRKEKILSRFPGRTEADLYIWIIKHWHSLKEQCGSLYPLNKAASDYADTHGRKPFQKWFRWIRFLWNR